MKVLVVGSGGREHAIVWKVSQSPKVDRIYCAPGNAGISQIAECIDINADNIEGLRDFALRENIDLTIVGPEVPLVLGIVDEFKRYGLRCFGPEKRAAEIEGSKVFSKYLMKKYNIPTAQYMEFSNANKAIDYLKSSKYPIVIKADGLAAGKGVIIAQNFDEASKAVYEIMEDKIFSSAGDKIIIEEFLEGPEVSILAFTDGRTVKPMVSSKDHKRIYDNDLGPNTGGMGTISPNPYYTEYMESICMEKIFKPTIEAMNNEGRKFKGVLYFGLMLTSEGPKVLEYNCRFGDPETQVVLPRLKTDLVDIISAVIDEELDTIDIQWNDEAAVCVIIASGGYPLNYKKGRKIFGLDRLPEDIMVFHSGTKAVSDGIVSDGGRVLGVTAFGNTIREASKRIYSVIDIIQFDEMHYRKDIGKKQVEP